MAAVDALGKATRMEDAQGRYVEFVKHTFPRAKRLDGLRVVIDAANGAGYRVAPQVLFELGAEVIKTACEPNGTNINHKCGATHPQALADKVLETRADIGLALDGDGVESAADALALAEQVGRKPRVALLQQHTADLRGRYRHARHDLLRDDIH